MSDDTLQRWHWYQETPYGMRSACLRFFVGLGSSKSNELINHPPDDELICEQCFEPYIRSTRGVIRARGGITDER